MTTEPILHPPATLLEALEQLRADGYGGQLIATTQGTLRCTACDEHSDAATLEVQGFYRLEGSSDAADLALVAWGACPACKQGGAITLGYGPNATAADEAVLARLDLDDVEHQGHTPAQEPDRPSV